jgi:hypothetical protein
MLEAKTDTQAAENENLRELLTRLQNENVQLKQAQFNFTFQQSPPSAGGNSTSAAGPSATGVRHPSQSSQSPTEPVLTQNPTPPTSKPTPDIHLFDAFSTSDSLSSFGISPPPTTNATANGTTNGNDLSWLNMFNTFPGVTNGSVTEFCAFQRWWNAVSDHRFESHVYFLPRADTECLGVLRSWPCRCQYELVRRTFRWWWRYDFQLLDGRPPHI